MKKGKVMKALVMLAMLLASVAASAQETAQPKSPAPQLEFVMQLNVSVGEAYAVGAVPQGHRQIIPITGGSFAGPLIRGEVLNGGADYQLSTDGGGRTQLEAIYSIRTDDGVNIHVRNMGLICNGRMPRAMPLSISVPRPGSRLRSTASMPGLMMPSMCASRHSVRLGLSFSMCGRSSELLAHVTDEKRGVP